MNTLERFGGRRLAALVLSLLVMVSGALAGGVARAQPVGQGDAAGPACAWQIMSNDQILNVAFPDSGATYWVLPYHLGPGQSITLTGQYPDARYFSLNTYGTDFNTVDTLRDNQIQPEEGSANPYATVAPSAAGRNWTATVVSGPADPARNEIRGLREGQQSSVGFLIVRIYVPADPASPSGGVHLPTVTMNLGGGMTLPLSPCATPFDPRAYSGPIAAALTAVFDRAIGNAAAGAFPGGAPEATFITPASTSGLFPNGDNKYIGAGLTYQPGRVLVIRGMAPSFPDTRAGESPATTGVAMRYWSMCQNDRVTPYPVVGCADDYQTRIDSGGYYTFVVAAAEDMTASADSTITMLPWGDITVPNKVVFIRNMLPSEQFYPWSIQAAQDSGVDPATSMGPYYPRATYCDVTVLQSQGWQACYT
ncbi:hypothetical protein [Millisia brevis]|uniref:hypothetical protein n=1 Tax=Millisia brevis TaxID=264148 RepID=UPI000830A421